MSSFNAWCRGRLVTVAVAMILVAAPAAGGAVREPRPAPGGFRLDVDRIFAPEPLTGRAPDALTWSPDGRRFLFTLPGGGPGPLDTYRYDVAARRFRVFFRAAAQGKGARPAPEFVWSPDSRKLAYLDAGDLWVIDADGSHRRRLAAGADDPQWSPDSRRVAYVHENDVYAIAASGPGAARFSFDGGPLAVNGDPDWVYSEELEMRHAFAWSPDSTRIAYLRFDQHPIAPFPIVDFLNPLNTVAEQRYPLAGGVNSIVTLRVAAANGRSRALYTTRTHGDYLASVGWTPGGKVTAQILDRPQTHLRFVEFGPHGVARTLMREHDWAWVDVRSAPVWLHARRRFLFVSDRDGQAALYCTDADTGGVKRLTHGYAVLGLAGVDEKLHVAYVDAAYPTRRDSTVLSIPLGGGLQRPLAGGPGTHRFTFAPDARSFVRSDSSFTTPPVRSIGSTLGGARIPFRADRLPAGLELGAVTALQIDSRWGKLDAWLIRPPRFDPRKRYPVVVYVYGGPAAPTTGNSWGGATYLFHQALAQRGFIVFSVDGPGSQIDSRAAVRRLFHRLGPASLAGQLAGVAYLRTLPYVDVRRIGLWGWSFGGYETTYALTHAPGVFKVGVAVAPVTDWRFYDSIYTERYMGMPVQNAAAYLASSSVAGAARFAGRLLISHGTGDDNVHLANSIALLQALIVHGKPVDFMVYPRKAHGITGIPQRRQLFTHMLHYWQEHL